jgi:glycosyltransferase involved in cell wall biosynthesis
MARLDREDAMLMIVGDGPHLPSLRESAKDRTDIVFAGQVIDGVGIYFDAAEVYVLPGTGGLGINEAMAHSMPIISGYADGSADDLVIDGENGYRLREDTVEELQDRIARILDNPDMAASMGAKSREWITGKFSFQRFLDRVEGALLRQIEVKN